MPLTFPCLRVQHFSARAGPDVSASIASGTVRQIVRLWQDDETMPVLAHFQLRPFQVSMLFSLATQTKAARGNPGSRRR